MADTRAEQQRAHEQDRADARAEAADRRAHPTEPAPKPTKRQGLDEIPAVPAALAAFVKELRRLGIVSLRDVGDGVQVEGPAGASVTYSDERLGRSPAPAPAKTQDLG